MKKTLISAVASTLALVATLVLSGGTAAQAATVKAPHRVIPAASCWLDITSGQSLCVPRGVDLLDAVQAATGTTSSLPVGTRIGNVVFTKARAQAALLTTSAAAAQDPVSVIYDDVSHGGGSFYLSATSGGCTWGMPNLGTYGWNDRASSFKSFNGCTTALFKNNGYGGTKIGYSSSKSSLGSMNDAASSWSTE